MTSVHNTQENLPKFAKELLRFVSTTPQFILYGNIYDIYPFPYEGSYASSNMPHFIANLFQKFAGFHLVVEYVPLEGFKLLYGDQNLYSKVAGRDVDDKVVVLDEVYSVIDRLINPNTVPGGSSLRSAVILNFASRMSEISTNRDYPDFTYKLFRSSLDAKPRGKPPLYNPVLFLIEKENDIPAWYILENPRVKLIPVPKPDAEIREWLARAILPRIEGWSDLSPSRQSQVIKDFVNLTSGMFGRELLAIATLTLQENLKIEEMAEATRRYKLGVPENPWSKIDKSRLQDAETILSQRVIGQPAAIRKVSAILKRSFFNLSGAQFSRYSNKPKGILFFAGPTGVGKTELAKAITELIFGSEHHYIRFDMSEFAHEHSDQRLIGAPPGYVGYDVGGELTNAIKQNPFSVILFDEIEKAHPKLWDIFLQILDDGRLTSGRGETVYFSESLIIFTSNLGVYEVSHSGQKYQRIHPDMSFEEIQQTILSAIHSFFKFELGRPEILNRIGGNIVVFDFIRQEHAQAIMEKMLSNVSWKLADERKIFLEIGEKVKRTLLQEIVVDLSMGGRGIGNKLETVFINPLSRLLFDLFPSEGSTLLIESLEQKEGEWILHGQVTG